MSSRLRGLCEVLVLSNGFWNDYITDDM